MGSEIDTLAAETCAYMSQKHPDFSTLAARIAVSNLHKSTSGSFSETCRALFEYRDEQGRPASLIAEDVAAFVQANAEALDAAVDYRRDFEYDYFGFKTLEKSYLLRIFDKIVERPQHMLMRVACGIHCGDVAKVVETYTLMSQRKFTHATPTLFNAGTPKPQMSSCFLLTMKNDSIDGIYDTLKQCALISKCAGGIGVAVSNVRAKGGYIRGTNGHSNGLVPMLRNFNETARYVDQGGGKRKGSFAMYLEPWHADVYDFLELKKNHGKEEQRARDLFYALWIPDLFMRRVKEDKEWTLFCPNEAFEEARRSNMRHRPVSLGVQGLADAFLMLRMPFESAEAQRLNEDIFETIYFAACEASCELAEREGAYEPYEGSPASKGKLQFDLWNRTPKSGRWDWGGLKSRIAQHGLRNSLLVAPMPTASTAQILGNNESFEPYTQNLYVRRVLSGEFVQVNRHLLRDLVERGLWNEDVRIQLIAHNGSVQHIDQMPSDIKELYKTVWEIKQRAVLDMAADRGIYIDQSQSLNIHMVDATTAKLSSMHFHAWQLGLKTGMYYLRTKAAVDAIKFTVEVDKMKRASVETAAAGKPVQPAEQQAIASLKAEAGCLNCSA